MDARWLPFVNTAEPPRFQRTLVQTLGPPASTILLLLHIARSENRFWMSLVRFSCDIPEENCEVRWALDRPGPCPAIDAKRIAFPAQMLDLDSLVPSIADGRKKEPLRPQIWPSGKHKAFKRRLASRTHEAILWVSFCCGDLWKTWTVFRKAVLL